MKIFAGSMTYYGIIDAFTDKWNDAYYKRPREVPDEVWEEYQLMRKRFCELHDFIEEQFERSATAEEKLGDK